MRILLSLLLVVPLILFPVPSLAWGPNGHMTIGSIADALLAGTNAGRQTREILGTNLRTAAIWADCAKNVNTRTFKYEGEGRLPECAIYENPQSELTMERFVQRNLGNCIAPHNTEACHKQYHYTDVSIQRDAYMKGQIGTSEHDVTVALSAAIAVLQGKDAPPPFRIAGQKEALRLLVHYVGDIHQPLHVGSVYLDAMGQLVDPDTGTFDPLTETIGANSLLIGSKRLHGEWDNTSGPFSSEPPTPEVLSTARSVPATAGPLSVWSAAWATESLILARQLFIGITYSNRDPQNRYQITTPAGYDAMKVRIQHDQIVKAGARLAQVLTQIWPN